MPPRFNFPALAFSLILALLLPGPSAGAQQIKARRELFEKTWAEILTDPVKLVDIGPVTGDGKNSLVLLVGSRERNDYKRRLQVVQWTGSQWNKKWEAPEFLGTTEDVLLAGPFRAPSAPAGEVPDPQKRPKAQGVQIVSTGGVFQWAGGGFSRLYDAPAGAKLALLQGDYPALLLVGTGDSARAYALDETDAHLSTGEPPADGEGYVKFGIGAQEFAGVKALNFDANTRFIQSCWRNNNRWFVGLAKGSSSPTQEEPDATIGDKIVVYAPKRGSARKSFWKTGRDEMEEVWRSEPLGRVLDVRIGDPRNEGREGILVLTSEDQGRTRRLTFYAPTR